MEQDLFNLLQVRFIKLKFTISFRHDSILPKDKVSALRGGLGKMLLSTNCIRDRQCSECDFENECVVQRIIYSKFAIKPEFVTTEAGVGYILECCDIREKVKCGDKLDFYLILFGKTIVYFYQIYQAFVMLGEKTGIGKYHSKFTVERIKNFEGVTLQRNNYIDMKNYVIHRLYDYILFRKLQIGDVSTDTKIRMTFDTPATLKSQGAFIQKFEMEPILNAIIRRLYMLNCFEGIKIYIDNYEVSNFIPEIMFQEYKLESLKRYSNRKEEKMVFKGLKGYLVLRGVSEEVLTLLLIGELIHIGKNTTFGFGQYHLKLENED